MADDKPKALNLDELFGQAKTVKIVHNNREYELLKMEALGPKQAVQLQKMQKRAEVLRSLGEEVTEEQGIEIEELFDSMIKMLCPEFPVNEITFGKKMRIVMYYMEETQGKKAMETALKTMTGRKRSRK